MSHLPIQHTTFRFTTIIPLGNKMVVRATIIHHMWCDYSTRHDVAIFINLN